MVILLAVDFIDPALVELLFLDGLGELDFNDPEVFVIKFFELCREEEDVFKLKLLGEEDLFSVFSRSFSLSFSFFSVFLLVD